MDTARWTANRRILVIDDNDLIHQDFRKILTDASASLSKLDEAGAAVFGRAAPRGELPVFRIDSAYQGEEGLAMVRKAARENRPYAIAFVDVRMPPGWDGVETARRIWDVDPAMQIVLCTAYSDYSIGDIVGHLGARDSLLILKKPFDPAEAHLLAITLAEKWRLTQQARGVIRTQSEYIADARRVMNIIQQCHTELETAHDDLRVRAGTLASRLQQRTVEILATRDVTAFALAQLAESRDSETGEHLERIRLYVHLLAEELAREGPYADRIDAEFLRDIDRSSPLHDIGKVGIPDAVLLKPGPLTAEEFEIMKQHTVIGADALEKAARRSECGSFLGMAAEIARHHHERYDGGGYPAGLAGRRIPLSARIVALADVFDALTSARVYKRAMPPEQAKELIERQRREHFDPAVVDTFLSRYDDILQIKKSVDGHPSEELVGSH